jgi:hypothetical protein
MSAPAVHSLSTSPRTRRSGVAGSPDQSGGGPATVTITVHIDLHGQQLPPAAVGLFESLRALTGISVGDVSVTNTPTTNPPVASASVAAPLGTEPAGPPPASGLRSRLVRRGGEGTASGPSLRVYLASRMVLRDGVPVRLTRREYDLLVFLCQHPHRVFNRGQLLRQVWGYEMVSGERTVDVHVRRLRVKLGGRGPVIATIRGVGYRLDDATQVTVVPDSE